MADRAHSTSRRALLAGLSATPLFSVASAPLGLAGEIIGLPTVHQTSLDLTFAAEEWLRDAQALGLAFAAGPDGELWRFVPMGDGRERADARERFWTRLQDRPRLKRAVYAAARRQFEAQAARFA